MRPPPLGLRNRGDARATRESRFPRPQASHAPRDTSGEGWLARALACGFDAQVWSPWQQSSLLPFEPNSGTAAPPAMEKEQAPPTTPSAPTEAKAEAKEDPNRLPSFIPRTGLVFSERTAFAPVLCPPKLLPIRPYHVQRGQAQDSDDDDEAPPPKEGEEKKNESTTDVYDKRYLAEKKLIGDWGREPVVDEGYDPSKPLELVQKPAAEPAAAS